MIRKNKKMLTLCIPIPKAKYTYTYFKSWNLNFVIVKQTYQNSHLLQLGEFE